MNALLMLKLSTRRLHFIECDVDVRTARLSPRPRRVVDEVRRNGDVDEVETARPSLRPRRVEDEVCREDVVGAARMTEPSSVRSVEVPVLRMYGRWC